MSKPIRLTDDMRIDMGKELISEIMKYFKADALRDDAIKSLAKCQMSDGQFSFKKEFKFERKFEYKDDKRRITINITPEAYAKMLTVIMTNSEEVGWHGTSKRISETEFLIDNIFIYPQQVTAVTVDTDDEEYAKWTMDLDKIDENIFPNLHFHGHSHVNMGCTPSATDMGHRDKIVAQLGDDDYYIFMIWNKSLSWSASVYDIGSNTLYESKDIDVRVGFSDGTTAGDIVEDVKAKVKPRTYQPKVYYPSSTYPYYGGSSYTTGQDKDKKKDDVKTETKKNWWEEEKEKRKKEVSGVGNDPEDFPWERASLGYNGIGGYGGYGEYGYYD